MTAGADDQRLRVDTRVVTTAGAKVTINYDKGCDVRLEENQRFTVREAGECAALIATVEGTGVAGAGVGAGTAPLLAGGTGTLVVVGGLVAGGAIIYGITRDRSRNVSPN